MIKYFLNRKFWLPIVLVILLSMVLELLLRFGAWDNYIKPQSFLGNAVYRQQAIEEFGLNNIHWITIGDSRSDWGLEHNKILSMQKQNGINHLRMSFESSNFMAMQATIDWSIAHMPNLKGIMFGVAEENFGHFSAATKQYKVAWPFRKYFDYNQYKYFDDNQNFYSYFARNALVVHFEDLKQFIISKNSRLNKIKVYLEIRDKKILKFNRNMPGNICEFPVTNLKQCVQSANFLSQKITRLNGAEQFIVNVCNTNHANYLLGNDLRNYELNEQSKNDIFNNWQKLFSSILDKEIKLKVIVLPEHSLFDYIIKPSNTHEIVNKVIDSVKHRSGFELLDLRGILKANIKSQQCQYFQDPLHYNNLGKKIITHKIIDSFSLSDVSIDAPKVDNIYKNQF